MEPTERCRFDLAVELEASATHTWEEICAVNQTIGDGALAEALGNPEELSYGWSVETSTGRVLIHVSAPWVDDTASLLKPFGDLVEVTEGPLITG